MGNHKSKATVKTVRLNKDEADRARKSAVGEKSQAREKFIVKAEASATAFEANYAKLKAINEQHAVLYRSFKEIAAESREQLIAVRYFFAHKNDGELLFGLYAVGEEWSKARCGVGFDYVCRCINPPAEQKLLKDVNEDVTKTAQSSVSVKPIRKAADDLQELLAALPTDAAREKFMKKFDAQVADLKVKNEAETEAALAKQAAELGAETEKQRKKDEKEAARKQQIAVENAREDGFTDGEKAGEVKTERQVLGGIIDAEDHKALELADTFARNIAVAVNASGTVNDVKAVKAARKAAVAYCKLRGISFLAESTPSMTVVTEVPCDSETVTV